MQGCLTSALLWITARRMPEACVWRDSCTDWRRFSTWPIAWIVSSALRTCSSSSSLFIPAAIMFEPMNFSYYTCNKKSSCRICVNSWKNSRNGIDPNTCSSSHCRYVGGCWRRLNNSELKNHQKHSTEQRSKIIWILKMKSLRIKDAILAFMYSVVLCWCRPKFSNRYRAHRETEF